MFTKRKPDPEKKHFHVQKWLLHDNGHYRFQIAAKSKKKHTLESKMHPVECVDRQCKITVEKFKSCSSQAEYSSFLLCGKIHLQLEIDCFEVWEDTILVFPCDCVAVLHPNERSEPFFEQHNPNST